MFTELSKQTKPVSLFTAYPTASDRERWEQIPTDYCNSLIKAGESFLGYQFPPIYATDFMEFCRNGNRTNYEDKLFFRRTALNTLVLAECAEYQGRFLDDIINLIFLMCGESAWQLPAHNSYIRDTPQFILPDITRPVVDLFAAETGAVLSTAEYLLKDELDQVSPAICAAIDHNVKTRVLIPYETEHFWWMGDGVSPMNNWTSWCTNNVLLSAFTRPLPKEEQELIFQKACKSLDYFIAEYGEDGCCDEGAQYYRHAGLTMFGCMEILNFITNGVFQPLYKETKIKNIAAYIQNVHIAGPYYANFADCSPIAGSCGVREYLFAKSTDNRSMMAFAAQDYQNDPNRLRSMEQNLFYRLQAAFYHQEMMKFVPEHTDCQNDHDIFYPSVGLFLTSNSHYNLAVKAGDNADSHNHNDVGSFTIYKDGKPLFIDIGVESYTKKTFSPQRYEIWTMQSQYHNLPTFHDTSAMIMQKDGEDYAAAQVSHIFSDTESSISMELKGAYPDDRIRSYFRKAVLQKGEHGGITITDTYEGELQPVVLSLITYEKPEIIAVSKCDESKDSGDMNSSYETALMIGKLASCHIKGISHVDVEEIPVTDPRLMNAWKHSVYRILVTMNDHTIQLQLD